MNKGLELLGTPLVVGTGSTDVGRVENSSGVFSLTAYTGRQIAFGNDTNGEHVRIDADGNVGIGTTSPGTPLHVFSTGTTQARFVRDLSTDVGLTIGNDSSGVVFGTIGVHNYQFYANSARRLNISSTGAVTFNEAFTFPTSDGSGNQVLQTDGSGNVSWATIAGVGTPTEIADADGDTKIQVEESSDEDIIRFDTAGTERMTLSPSVLSVRGTTNPEIELLPNGTVGNADLRFDGTTFDIRSNSSSASLVLSTSSTERLRIKSNGNVGINQTNLPTHRLQVAVDTNGAFIKRDVASNPAII